MNRSNFCVGGLLLVLHPVAIVASPRPVAGKPWSARQQPPLVIDIRRACVAVASAREGAFPAPADNPDSSRLAKPVLEFPQAGLDDTAAYQGYQTRFYRDSKGNTVQIYLQPQTSRAVLVWADAANESVGFSVRTAQGRPTRLLWGAPTAEVSDSGATRTIEFRLTAATSTLHLGWFVLGSMRVERDFVYAKRYEKPFGPVPFRVAEESLLVAGVAQLPADERQRHLELLGADNLDQLRVRLSPAIDSAASDSVTSVTV